MQTQSSSQELWVPCLQHCKATHYWKYLMVGKKWIKERAGGEMSRNKPTGALPWWELLFWRSYLKCTYWEALRLFFPKYIKSQHSCPSMKECFRFQIQFAEGSTLQGENIRKNLLFVYQKYFIILPERGRQKMIYNVTTMTNFCTFFYHQRQTGQKPMDSRVLSSKLVINTDRKCNFFFFFFSFWNNRSACTWMNANEMWPQGYCLVNFYTGKSTHH